MTTALGHALFSPHSSRFYENLSNPTTAWALPVSSHPLLDDAGNVNSNVSYRGGTNKRHSSQLQTAPSKLPAIYVGFRFSPCSAVSRLSSLDRRRRQQFRVHRCYTLGLATTPSYLAASWWSFLCVFCVCLYFLKLTSKGRHFTNFWPNSTPSSTTTHQTMTR